MLCAAFLIVTGTQQVTGRIDGVASMVFVLAVFLISIYTDGYVWGVVASLIGVLAVNFAFRSPYFAFNFTLPENLFSGMAMLVVSIMTSTLTTRIKKQEQLRMESETEKMRATLLRAVSHDLRTPLTSIYGACSTVIENYDSLEKEQKLKLLGEACSDAQWLNRMVENLLSVTRFDGGQVAVQKTPTVLDELIDTVLVRFQKRYPKVPVTTYLPDSFIVIPMDSMLISQVLTNLLENAAVHAEGMTQLTLRVFTLAAGRCLRYRTTAAASRRSACVPCSPVCCRRCRSRQRQARHGHWPFGLCRHRQGTRRRDPGREQGGRGHHHPLLAGDRIDRDGGKRR